MNVEGLLQALQGSGGRGGSGIVIQGSLEFGSTLQLGQVLKGKVLRHYEGNRYGVALAGEERVVDSAVPLRTGDIIYGRVTGIGEQVHLQRLRTDSPPAASPLPKLPDGVSLNAREQVVAALFAQHGEEASLPDLRALAPLLAQPGDAKAIALGALVLRKLGMPIAAELVRAVQRALAESARADRKPNSSTLGLAPGLGTPDEVQGTLETLARYIQAHATSPGPLGEEAEGISTPESGTENSDAGGDGEEDRDEQQERQHRLGTFLLNAQSQGSVEHRMMSFPLLLGERVVEVKVALFSERQRTMDAGLRHRQVVFSLQTETLGLVELSATSANDVLRLRVTTGTKEATDSMAQYLDDLKQVLGEHGWTLADVAYLTANPGSAVGSAVVDHYVSQDSLNRLL